MSSPVISDFLIDDLNETKFISHGLSSYQIIQVLTNTHIIVPNRKRRRGLYLVIGSDNIGRCIAIPVERTYNPRLWRPITAWLCKDNELAILKKREKYDRKEFL
jgi:hypothetical protein